MEGALTAAVEQLNATEMDTLRASCNQRRQKYLNDKCWEFRALFAAQQQLLTSAGIPQFNGPTMDANVIFVQKNVCSFLHSAFCLRAKIGEKDHINMMKSQELKLSNAEPVPMPGLPTRTNTATSGISLPPHVNFIPGLQQYPPSTGYHIQGGQQQLNPHMYMQHQLNSQNQVQRSYH